MGDFAFCLVCGWVGAREWNTHEDMTSGKQDEYNKTELFSLYKILTDFYEWDIAWAAMNFIVVCLSPIFFLSLFFISLSFLFFHFFHSFFFSRHFSIFFSDHLISSLFLSFSFVFHYFYSLVTMFLCISTKCYVFFFFPFLCRNSWIDFYDSLRIIYISIKTIFQSGFVSDILSFIHFFFCEFLIFFFKKIFPIY